MRISRWPIHQLEDLIDKLKVAGYECATLQQTQSVSKAKNGYPRKQIITLEFTLKKEN
jgi:hypothetical protein